MNASGESYGIRRLLAFFLAWKFLLLVVACASPGPGYDTSTKILFDEHRHTSQSRVSASLEHVVLRLTRWDGIYFATLAERDHVNEQDWAFSWVLARFTDWSAKVFFAPLSIPSIVQRALMGIIISHISHLLAVTVLYHLTKQLIPSSSLKGSRVAFTAAVLHIISPAGLFLSAPYGESTFAFLNFAGTLSYILAVQQRYAVQPKLFRTEALYTLLSGMFIAGAATVRGNGILGGIPFAWDALQALLQPAKLIRSSRELRRLLMTGIAGMLVGIGFAFPQFIAYREYCTEEERRIWCDRIPPSIYNWVQDHYWGVGFLRYWTLSNLPLFLIAGPVLGVLVVTGITCLWRPDIVITHLKQTDTAKKSRDLGQAGAQKVAHAIIRRLALPQLALATLTATSFHIQIINRISSGYPLWYIVLAVAIHGPGSTDGRISEPPKTNPRMQNAAERAHMSQQEARISSPQVYDLPSEQTLQLVVRGTAMYAIIQGGLYASFLPPA